MRHNEWRRPRRQAEALREGEAEALGNVTTNRTRGVQRKAELWQEVEARQEAEANAPVDNRRWQHNEEATADKRQRRRRTGAGGTNGVSWQRGEWQIRQQEEAEVNFCFPIFWAKAQKKTWSVRLAERSCQNL